jgi:arylsulfatase A-like enzyme
MPTVLDITGLQIPSRVEGRSLLPMMKDRNIPGLEQVFTSSSFVNPGDTDLSVDCVPRWAEKASMATVTTDDWTLLYDVEPGGSELYNLKSDPHQENNIIAGHEDVARDLHKLLVKHLKDTGLPKRLLDPRLEIKF